LYRELYENWKQEITNTELGKLPPVFYSRVAEYMRKLREESRMLDKKTAKAVLLKKETIYARRMLQELIKTRYNKLIEIAIKSKNASPDTLTEEETAFYAKYSSLTEAYRNFIESIVHGHMPKIHDETKQKRMTLRFSKEVPAIIGVDMKTYGPFKTEDVASLPFENCRILIKQGLAAKIEIN